MLGSNRGFTLLEILIAITLLAFIVLGVISITDNAMNTKERTTEINRNNLQIETALSRFEWDYSQIYSPLYFSTPMQANQGLNQGNNTNNTNNTNNNNTNQPIDPAQLAMLRQAYFENLSQRYQSNEHFVGVSKEALPIPRFYAPEKDIFEFFTTSNRRKTENVRQSHFAWVRYSLAEDNTPSDNENENPGAADIPKGLKSLVRYFSPDDPYNEKRINPEDTKVKGAVLLRNVESLEFQFWDYQRKKWENNLRTIQNGESLSRGVRMLLTWYDQSGHKRSIIRTFRNHWPMVAPPSAQPVQPQAGANAGTPGGTPQGGTTQGGTPQGGTPQGAEGGEE